jgi:hypothetical protein
MFNDFLPFYLLFISFQVGIEKEVNELKHLRIMIIGSSVDLQVLSWQHILTLNVPVQLFYIAQIQLCHLISFREQIMIIVSSSYYCHSWRV